MTLRLPTAAQLGLDVKELTADEVKVLLQPYWDAEVGLLLLVLKDLWTGFLPVGGSSSVGRGRLQGRAAQIEYGSNKWTLVADGAEKVTLSPDGAAETLNKYVTAFTQYVTGGRDGGQ